MKVKDFLKLDCDIDVYDDVCEELGIAFCGPMELTDEGAEHFAEALEYEIEINDDVAIVHVDDDEDKVWKRKLRKAKELFEGLAGYCAADDYDRWFREVERV